MEVFVSTFEAMATLFIIGMIGFTVMRRRLVPEDALSAISPLFLEVALPAMGFIKIIESFHAEEWQKLLILPSMWVGFTFVVYWLAILFKHLAKSTYQVEFAMTLFFQNAVFIPLIILHRLYGSTSEYIVDLFLFSLFYSPFFFHYNHLFVQKRNWDIRWDKLYHPVVLSTILAVVIVLFGVQHYLPKVLYSSLSMVGGMAIPLLMVIVGGNLYLDFSRMEKFEYFEVLKFVLVKNFIFPTLALLLIWIFPLRYNYALLLLLQAAAPPLMAVPLFAMRLERNRAIVNQFILGSIFTSIFSIPLFYWLFKLLMASA